jgi:hypothetical protein
MKEGTSSGVGAAAAANDPRQPSTAKPYSPPKLSAQDLPMDYAGFVAVVFGVFGVMLHVRSDLVMRLASLFPQIVTLGSPLISDPNSVS